MVQVPSLWHQDAHALLDDSQSRVVYLSSGSIIAHRKPHCPNQSYILACHSELKPVSLGGDLFARDLHLDGVHVDGSVNRIGLW